MPRHLFPHDGGGGVEVFRYAAVPVGERGAADEADHPLIVTTDWEDDPAAEVSVGGWLC